MIPSRFKEQTVDIKIADDLHLMGNLTLSKESQGLVIFAHGSGSSRLSPRNRYVASALNQQGLATLLFDLLTADEEATDIHTAEYRFNIPLLAERLKGATRWIKHRFNSFHLGYFGSSTGAGAALIAAADHSLEIEAVVSRGGRPDLAGNYLTQVSCPCLLVVGGEDTVVIDLNRMAASKITAIKKIAIVPNATHLFEEPGTLDQVISLTAEWFKKYLGNKK